MDEEEKKAALEAEAAEAAEAEKAEAEKAEADKAEEEAKAAGFKKEGEEISVNEHNQALRKAREAEMRERDLKKKLEEKESVKTETKEPEKKVEVKVEPKKEAPKKDEFWDDEDEEEKAPIVEDKTETVDVMTEAARMVEEKMKPFYEEQERKELKEKEDSRTVFFEKHPEFLKDSARFALLLDTMETKISPEAGTYYEQMELASLIVGGKKADPSIEAKKAEIAAESGGGGTIKQDSLENDGLTAKDRKIAENAGVSEAGMKSFNEKLKSGRMTLMGVE
jgi:hypothetical protein